MTQLSKVALLVAMAGLASAGSAFGASAHSLPSYPRLGSDRPRNSKGGRYHFVRKDNPAGTKLAKKAAKGTLTKCGIK